MKIYHLTYFIYTINAAIDTGKYQDISIEEVEEHIENGDLIPYLRERLKGDVDLSIYDPELSAKLNEELASILGGYKGQERRKWGISNSGLCLLVAWTTQLIYYSFGDCEYRSPFGS